jgi:hypothetical protein
VQNNGLEKRYRVEFLKLQKDYSFSYGIQNHKVCCIQTLHVALKQKYFIKPCFLSKTPKILCSKQGLNLKEKQS